MEDRSRNINRSKNFNVERFGGRRARMVWIVREGEGGEEEGGRGRKASKEGNLSSREISWARESSQSDGLMGWIDLAGSHMDG